MGITGIPWDSHRNGNENVDTGAKRDDQLGVLDMGLCLSVRPSVRHKSVFY